MCFRDLSDSESATQAAGLGEQADGEGQGRIQAEGASTGTIAASEADLPVWSGCGGVGIRAGWSEARCNQEALGVSVEALAASSGLTKSRSSLDGLK